MDLLGREVVPGLVMHYKCGTPMCLDDHKMTVIKVEGDIVSVHVESLGISLRYGFNMHLDPGKIQGDTITSLTSGESAKIESLDDVLNLELIALFERYEAIKAKAASVKTASDEEVDAFFENNEEEQRLLASLRKEGVLSPFGASKLYLELIDKAGALTDEEITMLIYAGRPNDALLGSSLGGLGLLGAVLGLGLS